MIDQKYSRKNQRNNYIQSNQRPQAYIPSPRIIYHPQKKQIHHQVTEKYLKTIGLLRVSWRNQRNNIVSINYGTAVAVNSRTLLTCSHNIYSQKQDKICSEIIFVPGLSIGRITDKDKQYKVKNTFNFCFAKPKTTFAYKPQRQQIAMIVLQEELNLEQYMPVGELQSMTRQPLQVIGYPSQKYQATVDMRKVQVWRSALKGKLLRIQGHVIHHTMPTKSGHSGSPIIAFTRENKPYIVGIHTHRGLESSYNSGIYFNNQNLKTLQKYQKKLYTTNRIQMDNFFKKDNLSDYYQCESIQWTEDQSADYLQKLIKQQLQADRDDQADDEFQVRAQANLDNEDDNSSDQSDMNEVVSMQNQDEFFLNNIPDLGNDKNKKIIINKEKNHLFRKMYELQ